MDVRVDQAGHEGTPSAVDHGGARRRLDSRGNLFDQVTLDEHVDIKQLVVRPVEHLDVLEERGRLLGALLVAADVA